MTAYDMFAKYYDEMMGDRSQTGVLLCNLIDTYNPDAKTILELACGTGAVLELFTKKYTVSGLDMSAGMLAVAKKRIKSGKFYEGDMSAFALDHTFDVIFCVFDSINHLMSFSQWKSMFKQCHKHLNKNGVLIFDINTQIKLEKVVKTTPAVRIVGKNVMVMDVTDIGKGVTNWNVKIFEQQKGNTYAMFQEDIKEVSFSVSDIKKALQPLFTTSIVDPKRKRFSTKSDRLYFVCKKKAKRV